MVKDNFAAANGRIERAARCPACTQQVEGLVIRLDGKLRVSSSGVALLGFVCPHCGREIRWGNRKADRRVRI